MEISDLQPARYIALETFRKNGQGVITPVWLVVEGEKLYVWTKADSGKVKRIGHTPRVRLCESDYRGTPRGAWLEAQARILDSPEADQAQRQRLAHKYGWQFRLIDLFRGRLKGWRFVVLEMS